MPADPGIESGRHGLQGQDFGMETGTLHLAGEMLKPSL